MFWAEGIIKSSELPWLGAEPLAPRGVSGDGTNDREQQGRLGPQGPHTSRLGLWGTPAQNGNTAAAGLLAF